MFSNIGAQTKNTIEGAKIEINDSSNFSDTLGVVAQTRSDSYPF